MLEHVRRVTDGTIPEILSIGIVEPIAPIDSWVGNRFGPNWVFRVVGTGVYLEINPRREVFVERVERYRRDLDSSIVRACLLLKFDRKWRVEVSFGDFGSIPFFDDEAGALENSVKEEMFITFFSSEVTGDPAREVLAEKIVQAQNQLDSGIVGSGRYGIMGTQFLRIRELSRLVRGVLLVSVF